MHLSNNHLGFLAKHTFVYGLGSAVSAIAAFIMLPILTHALHTEDFGILELLNRIAEVLILVMFMGCRQAYIRFYYDDDSDEWHKTVTGTMIFFVLVTSSVVVLLTYLFSDEIIITLFKGKIGIKIFLLLLFWLPMEMFFNISMSFLQIKKMSLIFISINITKIILYIGGASLFLYYFDMNIKGVLLAQLISTYIVAAPILIYLINWSGFKVSLTALRKLVKFGLPYIPAAIFMYLLSNADRYFITSYQNLSMLGIYSLAYKIGMLGTMFIVEPFLKIWSPFLFENYNKENGNHIISDVFSIFVIINVTFALILSLVSFELIKIVSTEEYLASAQFIPLICLASVFYGLHHLTDAGILISKKTHLKPVIFGISAMVSITLNYLLIPDYGIYGASFACILSFFSLFLLTTYFGRKYFHFSINIPKFILLLLSACMSYLIGLYFTINGEHVYEGMILAITIYLFLIYIFRIISYKKIYSLFRKTISIGINK